MEEAVLELKAPFSGVIREDKDFSENIPEPIHRLYTGDNLPILKYLLQEIPQKVKVIYIDPPYNTGSILNYRDRFSVPCKKKSFQKKDRDLEGLVTTPSTDHSPWMSFMFPRLAIARQLLRPDGVIFTSIDDREFPRLKLLLDWIMGEKNHIGTIVWRKKVVRGRGNRHIIPQTEYILCYARNVSVLPPFQEPLTDDMIIAYTKKDAAGPYKEIPLAKSGTAHSPRPNLVYPITAPDGTTIHCPTHQWRWSEKTFLERKNEVLFRKTKKGVWRVLTKQYLETENGLRFKTPTSLYDKVTTTDGTKELQSISGPGHFDFPKPSRLIRDLISWSTTGKPSPSNPEIVLDFFAGTAPTAQAVIGLNREDQRKRICYLVQNRIESPENTDKILELAKTRIQNSRKNQHDQQDFPEGFRLYHYLPGATEDGT
jgi:adenine-specific DNA-methyltransferase